MEGEQDARGRRRAQHEEEEPGRTGQQQHQDEVYVHAAVRARGEVGRALPLLVQEAERPDDEADAADRAQQHRQIVPGEGACQPKASCQIVATDVDAKHKRKP